MSQVAPAKIDLPDPDTIHSSATTADARHNFVLIWDGHCNFCRSQVERLRRWDWTGQLTFLSLHDPRVQERYPDLTYDQLMEQMWLITPDGKRYGGADAMRVLSRRMPTLWPLAPIMHVPFSMPLWRSIYRWVAQRRYRIAGKNCDGGTCHLHQR